jgi:hypothetical protein
MTKKPQKALGGAGEAFLHFFFILFMLQLL